MRSTNDNPLDPLGTLGPATRPKPEPKPDPIREFERISDSHKAIETIAETLRKKAGALPVISDGQAEDWEGLV